MTIEHNADGTKTVTAADGTKTSHHDLSAALHFQETGARLAYDTPEGYKTPEQLAAEQAPKNAADAIDKYKARCRAVGRARANKALGIK